jgi:hypothetical protein
MFQVPAVYENQVFNKELSPPPQLTTTQGHMLR